MHLVRDLLSTILPSLFIITHKVSLFFFNLVLNTLFFVNFFSCLQFLPICTYSFYIWKTGLFRILTLREPFGSIIFSLTVLIYIYIYIYRYINFKIYTKYIQYKQDNSSANTICIYKHTYIHTHIYIYHIHIIYILYILYIYAKVCNAFLQPHEHSVCI